MSLTLPWAPLMTRFREALPEVTVYGILAVQTGSGQAVLSLGEAHQPLWSRSLLKPWQLWTHLETLSRHYPTLTAQDHALMLSSHNGEPPQIRRLEALLALGGFTEEVLHCPACYPMSPEAAVPLKLQNALPRRLYNPCSGKHLAALLSRQAQGLPLTGYLTDDPPLQTLLGTLLTREPETFPMTRDSCGMGMPALSAVDMAQLFGQLAQETSPLPLDHTLTPFWPRPREAMQGYPELVGGQGRLDSDLMAGALTHPGVSCVAKEGAEGLLGIGVAPCAAWPEGLGVCLKLAGGYVPEHLRTLTTALLVALGLSPDGITLYETEQFTFAAPLAISEGVRV